MFLRDLVDFRPRDSVVKRTFTYAAAALHRARSVASHPLEEIEDKRHIVAPPSFPKCLCVLKHIAGVHKVYLGESYTGDVHATTAREIIMRSTPENDRRVAKQKR